MVWKAHFCYVKLLAVQSIEVHSEQLVTSASSVIDSPEMPTLPSFSSVDADEWTSKVNIACCVGILKVETDSKPASLAAEYVAEH